MLETLIAVAIVAALIRYVWVSMKRDPLPDCEPDLASALDSIRAADPVEVRSSDFAPLAAANAEVSRRPRVRAGTAPLPTITNLKGTST